MTGDPDRLWTAVLDLVGQIVMPDWGAIVGGLLPLALAALVAATAGLLGRAWLRAWRLDPARQARLRRRAAERASRPRSPLAVLLRHLVLVPAGAVIAGIGLLDRSAHPSGNLGLVVGGLAVALVGVGLAVRASERLGGDEADGPAGAIGLSWIAPVERLRAVPAAIRRIPGPLRRLSALGLAVIGIALGLVVVPAPAGEATRPVANLPLLLVGLGIGLAVVARAVRNWERLDQGS